MTMHKWFKIDDTTFVMRVPGGLLYSATGERGEALAFVPATELQIKNLAETLQPL